GRKGLGSIFVWASGNGGMFQDDCSCDGYVSSIHTLAIGSVTDEGMSTYYGEVCPSVMGVVFAGGSHSVGVTTDLHGGCTLKFQGTSSAAPLAAGCIALVLEANANLTWRDVQHLVVETSVIPSEKEDGWKVNAAGYHVNHRFGFGVLDCGRMVEAAENWIGIQEQLKCVVKSQGPTRYDAINQSL
ncbi:hypothetical protein HELRODRAFT_93071, partial [Helobdella robusta]|uniref:Peptidase S8/S53 domain-containing protein n=1 Tax=Helobdella robusta TaxID=6412 RepID=T1G8S6_HELRO